jgi:hypothetical protein
MGIFTRNYGTTGFSSVMGGHDHETSHYSFILCPVQWRAAIEISAVEGNSPGRPNLSLSLLVGSRGPFVPAKI